MNRINRWMYGWRQRKVGNVLFNNEFNTVIYGYMAKDMEKAIQIAKLTAMTTWATLPFSTKGYFICTIP